jgi:hypothetical protein
LTARIFTVQASEELLARYEELRRQALQPAGAMRRGQGLALFMRRGMKEWLQAWSRCMVSNAKRDKEHREEMICADVRTDVVMIMAAMVLHGVTRQQHEQ